MDKISNSYDTVFKDVDKYDFQFETFKTDNNPIIEPINKMNKQIYKDLPERKYPEYLKEHEDQSKFAYDFSSEDSSEIVFGEPVYLDNQGDQN